MTTSSPKPVARLALVLVAMVALTLVALPGSAPAQAAERKAWRPTAGVKFNVARVGGERQFRLEQQIIAAIRHARPRSTIKMVMFSYDRMQVTDALLEARRERKVHVQVIVNGHELPAAQRTLKKALGSKRGKRSFFYQCAASCRGQGDVQHSKFVLFSKTGAARDVVMLGSLNMKLNGALNQYNDLLTVTNRPRLYRTLDTVFDEMRRDRPARTSYVVRDAGPYRLFVLPFPRPPKSTRKTRWTPRRDPISRLLAPVRCRGAHTDSGRTIIRVDMHAWDGDRGVMIAHRLRDLYAAGCDVRVLVGYAGERVRGIFANPTKRGRMPARSTGFDTDDDGEIDLYSHTKILTIDGHYDGERGRKVVVTGSSNFQDGGQYGDELILRVFSSALHRQYADHWGVMWRTRSHAFGESASLRRSDGGSTRPVEVLGTDSPEWRDE